MNGSFKGKKNLYICDDCGHGYVTQDRDSGVTPFTMRCLNPNCRALAKSMFYACPQEMLAEVTPALLWVTPSALELHGKPAAYVEHVKRGGLVARENREAKN